MPIDRASTQLRASALSLAICGALMLAVPAQSQAAAAGCVTKAEFRDVKLGMREARVHEIFGTAGSATGLGGENTIRHYSPCRAGGVIQVVFNPRGRVVSKSGSWIR